MRKFAHCLLILVCLSSLAAARAPLSPEDRDRLRQYRDRAESELRQNILPFWIRNTVDRERGGFYGEISNDLKVKKDAVRGSLLTSRVLWTYSAAFRRYAEPAYREMAEWAYRDLVERFWDREHDGVIWMRSADGKPLQTQKQVYFQVFALYGLSEYARATGNADALARAVQIFRRLEAHAKDREHGGYFEVCARDWTPQPDVAESLLEPLGVKSQNTHLHVMEAYSNLLRIWPDAELKAAQTALVGVMLDRILNSETRHLGLFFDRDWKPTTREISFGHDIEAAWLLTEAAELLGDPALLERVKTIAVQISRVTREQGLDGEGALYYEANPRGITRSQREWWPQAEGVVGFINAYQIGGDTDDLKASLRLWDFVENRLVDRKHGEWYKAVAQNGRILNQPKVSLWKCPYHNGRACMEFIERLDKLLAE